MFSNVLTKQSYQNEFEIKQTASLQFFFYDNDDVYTQPPHESFNDITKIRAVAGQHARLLLTFVKYKAKPDQ